MHPPLPADTAALVDSRAADTRATDFRAADLRAPDAWAWRLSLRLLPTRSPERRATRVRALGQLVRFGLTGVAGLVVDTGVVYALRGALGLYGAGLASYVVAASVTWYVNRVWTFAERRATARHGRRRQLSLFLLANLPGFALNRGTYAALVTWVPLCAERPVLAVAAGAVAGVFSNFALARAVVFR